MKRFRKFVTTALIGACALSTLPVHAQVNINIEGQGAKFAAYKVLDLTTSLKPYASGEDKHMTGETGSRVPVADGDKACDGTNHVSGCYNYAYTVNASFRDILKKIAGEDKYPDDYSEQSKQGKMKADTNLDDVLSDTEIVEWIRAKTDDVTQTRPFANRLWTEVAALKETSNVITPTVESESKNITVSDQGYYMIVEVTNADDPDSTSLVLLDTAGANDIDVKLKEDVPQLTKKIVEGTSLVDGADVNNGDTVNFRLTGTVPNNIDAYTKYVYVLHDTLADTLAFNSDSLTLTLVTKADASSTETRTTLTKDTDYTLIEASDSTTLVGECTFDISIADLCAVAKTKSVDLNEYTTVIADYTATVAADAVPGNPGNENKAHLEFSNDPYVEGSTSTTPDDTVKVFTFKLDLTKVGEEGGLLKGAMFQLQKKDGTGNWGTAIKPTDSSGNELDANSVTAESNITQFLFNGLGTGEYKLSEIVVPDGYLQLNDIEFRITAEICGDGVADTDADGNAIMIPNPDYDSSKKDESGYDVPETIKKVDDGNSDEPKVLKYIIEVKNADGSWTKKSLPTNDSGIDGESYVIDNTLGIAAKSITNHTGSLMPSTGEREQVVLLFAGIGALGVAVILFVVTRKLKDEPEAN